MKIDPMVLVVGTTSKENIHIEKSIMDWKYEAIPLNEEKSGDCRFNT